MTIKEISDNLWEIEYNNNYLLKIDINTNTISLYRINKPWKVEGKINWDGNENHILIREWHFENTTAITAESLLIIILKSLHL
jgi:hypothetical protein